MINSTNLSGWVKKTDFDTKITRIENKIPDVAKFVKKTDLDQPLHKLLTLNNIDDDNAIS